MTQATPGPAAIARSALTQLDALRIEIQQLLISLDRPANNAPSLAAPAQAAVRKPLRRKPEVTWNTLQRCLLLHAHHADATRIGQELGCTARCVRDMLKVARQPRTLTAYLEKRVVAYTVLLDLLRQSGWDAGAVEAHLAEVLRWVRSAGAGRLRKPELAAVPPSHIEAFRRAKLRLAVSPALNGASTGPRPAPPPSGPRATIDHSRRKARSAT